MTTNAWALRGVWLGIAALLLPACRGADSPAILFSENFNGAFPGTAWTVTGTATAVRDVLNGFNDTTSLRTSTASQPTSVTVASTTTFSSAAVKFSVHMAADTAAGTDEGIGTITIRDSLATVVASASWDEGAGTLILKIQGVAPDIVVAAPAPDLAFHRIVFDLTAGGTGTWSMDNGAALMWGTPAFVGPLTLELGASYSAGSGWALFYFDNIHVTVP